LVAIHVATRGRQARLWPPAAGRGSRDHL